MNKEKCDCQINGNIILSYETQKDSRCAKCGRILCELDWENVPWWRKLKRKILYPKSK